MVSSGEIEPAMSPFTLTAITRDPELLRPRADRPRPIATLRPSRGLLARLNPLNARSQDEIDAAIGGGASVLMLLFFSRASEVDGFVGLVDGRARVVLLVETAAAVVRLHDVLAVDGIAEVIVGLNDPRRLASSTSSSSSPPI
jgi:hypothetical protein